MSPMDEQPNVPPPHLVSAAKTLRLLLSRKYPEHSWVVRIRDFDGHDA